MAKSKILEHQKEYCQTMIDAYITLAKRHGEDLPDVITESFYYTNFSDVVITFTKNKKMINYYFKEVEQC